MKKALYCVLLLVLLFIFCGCSQEEVFTRNENGNLVGTSNIEYSHLANEGFLYYFGELEFVGSVSGEEKESQHLALVYQTGMFTIKGGNGNILIRHAPDNEWRSIYRKASLPEFDFSIDNCIRLEYLEGKENHERDIAHSYCGDGITDKKVISAFLSEVRAQPTPEEAGLYDLVRKENGMLENCYINSSVYAFFAEEPNLAVMMQITSYNDLAHSIVIEGKKYVLPEEWFYKLKNS